MFCITCTYINRLIMVLGSTTCHHSLCSRYYFDWEETRSVDLKKNIMGHVRMEVIHERWTCDTMWEILLCMLPALRVFCFLISYFIAVSQSFCNDYQSRLRMESSPKSKDWYWLAENQASNFNWSELTWILKKFIVYGRNYQNTFLP